MSGRTWHTLKAGNLPVGVTWTYDGGFMVAASDRATAERAIATRSGGSALVWSPAFQRSAPRVRRHASVRVRLAEYEGRARDLLGVVPEVRSQGVARLLEGRDPVLVVFDGKPDLIHAASRTRLLGVILDAMVIGSAERDADAAVAPDQGPMMP